MDKIDADDPKTVLVFTDGSCYPMLYKFPLGCRVAICKLMHVFSHAFNGKVTALSGLVALIGMVMVFFGGQVKQAALTDTLMSVRQANALWLLCTPATIQGAFASRTSRLALMPTMQKTERKSGVQRVARKMAAGVNSQHSRLLRSSDDLLVGRVKIQSHKTSRVHGQRFVQSNLDAYGNT